MATPAVRSATAPAIALPSVPVTASLRWWVSDGVGIGLGAVDGVADDVADGVVLGVGAGDVDGVADGLGSGVVLGVGSGDVDGVGLGLGDADGAGVGVTGVGVGLGLGVGLGADGLGLGVGVGVGVGTGSNPAPPPDSFLVTFVTVTQVFPWELNVTSSVHGPLSAGSMFMRILTLAFSPLFNTSLKTAFSLSQLSIVTSMNLVYIG